MRIRWLWALLFSTCLVLATSGVAWAHVVVSPEEVPANGYETFAVSVPTEKEIPTTEVRVEVPEGFTVSGVQPVPGWNYEFEEEGGVITAITWSGGEIQEREFQEFAFQAQAPENPGEYAWKAIQTYEDGSVVEWVGPEDSEEPASVVEVVASGEQSHGSEESGSHSEEDAAEQAGVLPDSGGVNPVVYAGFGALTLTIAVSLAVLRRRSSS